MDAVFMNNFSHSDCVTAGEENSNGPAGSRSAHSPAYRTDGQTHISLHFCFVGMICEI